MVLYIVLQRHQIYIADNRIAYSILGYYKGCEQMPSRGKITTCPCVLLLCYMILQCDWNIADNKIACSTLGYYKGCEQMP